MLVLAEADRAVMTDAGGGWDAEEAAGRGRRGSTGAAQSAGSAEQAGHCLQQGPDSAA